MRDKEFNKASEPTGAIEPEFITIVEGPPPTFQPAQETWVHSLSGGVVAHEITTCQTRTLKCTALSERCRRAWQAGRPVLLDFPDEIGLRRQLEVIAIRCKELPEGTLLHVWTRDDD
jgi:hypothetical protein